MMFFLLEVLMLSLLVVVFVETMIIDGDVKDAPQPASQQGPPALVSAHITQIGRPCHKGAVWQPPR